MDSLRLATARTIVAVLSVTVFTLAASEALADTGAQTWNFKLLGAVQVFGGVGPTFFFDGGPVGPITIPIAVSPDGSFSASFDVPTFTLGPCTLQATAGIPSGTFDTAIHLTFRWSITSIPPSGPLCASIPLTDTVVTIQLDKPFPNARVTTSLGTVHREEIVGTAHIIGDFQLTASCATPCGDAKPATITTASGSVQAILRGQTVALASGSFLFKGSTVNTGGDGQVQGNCPDGSHFTVGHGTSLFLDDSICETSSSGVVDLTQGQVTLTRPTSQAQNRVRAADPFGRGVRTPVNQTISRSADSDFSTTYSQLGRTGSAVTAVTKGSVDVTDPEAGTVTTVTAGNSITVTGTVPGLVAAVLPASRSVQVNVPATVYATMINTGGKTAVACQINKITTVDGDLTFQTTSAATNQLSGDLATPVSIDGGGSQSFLIAVTPKSPMAPTDVQLNFGCGGTQAPVIVALNTLLLSASTDPVPDIVALAQTPGSPLIVDLPGAAGAGVFVVAAANVGVAGTITVTADTGAAVLPLGLSVCQTDPVTSACQGAPGSSVTLTIGAGATPTFGIFVVGNGVVPFDPAGNRIFVRFKDAGGVTRGATSVAVRTL